MNKPTTIDADGKLTRQQLKELEAKEMTPLQRFFELVIMILPFVCGIVSIAEYRLIPDNSMNRNPNTYFWFLVILVGAYVVYGAYAAALYAMGKKGVQEKLRYRAPLFSALFLLLDADGINPQTDLTLTQVSSDACVAAMENGEISAALLSDTFAYAMVKEGKLKCIRSLLDSDFADENCCVLAMNRTFVQENPVHANKIVQAVQKAHAWMRDNPDECTTLLLDRGWNGGNYEMNIMINTSLQFGLADDFTAVSLRDVVERYVRLGLITNMDNVDEIMTLAWNPTLGK